MLALDEASLAGEARGEPTHNHQSSRGLPDGPGADSTRPGQGPGFDPCSGNEHPRAEMKLAAAVRHS